MKVSMHYLVGKCRNTKQYATGNSLSNNIVIDTTTVLQGFPYGTKPGEEERVSLPNANFSIGNYMVR